MIETDNSDLDGLIARVDPDRWLSSRFIVDAQARADVIAIYAFDHELARAPRVATNPMMGEIRLTWWREVLDEVFEAFAVRHHPTAQALAKVVQRRGISRDLLEPLIDARYRELDPRPMNLKDAMTWAENTGGSVAVLAGQILDASASTGKLRSGGQAWSIGMLMGTAGLSGNESQAALVQALADSRGISAAAFPAIAHATLARPRSRGRRSGPLDARLRVLAAVLSGRV